MRYKNWSKTFLILAILSIAVVALLNLIIDPYNIYNTNLNNLPKYRQDNKIRFVKAIKLQDIKPASIILGTSRADYGYNPDHPYFKKPSYNLAVNNATMYEAKLLFKQAIKRGNLKHVLIELDYIMFNAPKQKVINGLNSYFSANKYKYLLSYSQLKDSIYTILKINSHNESINMKNGAKMPNIGLEKIIKNGGYLKHFIAVESEHYTKEQKGHRYTDTKRDSYKDFEEFLNIAYDNNISVDIVFGPSHIRMWESLNYFLGFDSWLNWKRDIVNIVNKVAQKRAKKPFRVVDFAIYNKFTSEKIPTIPNKKMKYYRDPSHFNMFYGNMVLDWLNSKSSYKNLGVELTVNNIDKHLDSLKKSRLQYIDPKKYQKEVFGRFNHIK